MICPLRSADAKSGKVVQKFRAAGTNGCQDLSLFGEYLRTHLKDHTRYDQGPEIHGEPRIVSLPVGEAQLAGGAQCMGHAIRRSAICLAAPHLQLGKGAIPHLYMDKWNRPTPVLKRLSLTQVARDKPIPTIPAPVLEEFSQYSAFDL